MELIKNFEFIPLSNHGPFGVFLNNKLFMNNLLDIPSLDNAIKLLLKKDYKFLFNFVLTDQEDFLNFCNFKDTDYRPVIYNNLDPPNVGLNTFSIRFTHFNTSCIYTSSLHHRYGLMPIYDSAFKLMSLKPDSITLETSILVFGSNSIQQTLLDYKDIMISSRSLGPSQRFYKDILKKIQTKYFKKLFEENILTIKEISGNDILT